MAPAPIVVCLRMAFEEQRAFQRELERLQWCVELVADAERGRNHLAELSRVQLGAGQCRLQVLAADAEIDRELHRHDDSPGHQAELGDLKHFAVLPH